MLLKLGSCLLDPQKVVWVEKRTNGFGYELFVSFGRDSSICAIKADNPEQQDEFFNAIWDACSTPLPVATATWTYKVPEVGDNQNG